MARLAWGQPGHRPDQHVHVRNRLLHTMAGTRAQQLTMTSSPGGTRRRRARKGRHRDPDFGRTQNRSTRLQHVADNSNVAVIRKRLWMRSPGISLPLKVAGISFSERTAMLIGLDPATAAAADPPLGDATTPWDALRNVHECRIAARS